MARDGRTSNWVTTGSEASMRVAHLRDEFRLGVTAAIGGSSLSTMC